MNGILTNPSKEHHVELVISSEKLDTPYFLIFKTNPPRPACCNVLQHLSLVKVSPATPRSQERAF